MEGVIMDDLGNMIWNALKTLSKDSSGRVMMSLIAGSIFKHIISIWFRRKKHNSFLTVGRVASIFCYPVKSCRWLSVDRAFCTPLGIKYNGVIDRYWMFVRPNNAFLSQRQEPKMTFITPNVDDEVFMRLDAPGMEPLLLPKKVDTPSKNVISCSVWGNKIDGNDCGEAAAKWACDYLQKDGYRIVRSGDELEKRNIDPKTYVPVQAAQCVYQDSSPYHLLSQASIDVINNRIEKDVTVYNFRPNILVEGCLAFAEDTWDEIRIGDKVMFHHMEPCSRCILPTVDPHKGEKDPEKEPLKTLQKYRTPAGKKSPDFGVMINVDTKGWIQVGDPVYALLK